MRILVLILLLTLGAPIRAATPVALRIEMTEFAFRPSMIRLAANRQARLVLVNRGQLAHQFESVLLQRIPTVVFNDSLHVETERLDLVRLQPGGAATVEFYPRTRGRFAFACTIEGHREAGMVGILDVR